MGVCRLKKNQCKNDELEKHRNTRGGFVKIWNMAVNVAFGCIDMSFPLGEPKGKILPLSMPFVEVSNCGVTFLMASIL